MINIGTAVRFIPFHLKGYKSEETAKLFVPYKYGKVVAVYPEHDMFTAEYPCGSKTMMLESFKYSQIGSDVFVC